MAQRDVCDTDVRHVVGQLTTREKAALCSGSSFWATQGNDRVGVPAVTVTDGPHGVRMQAGSSDHLGLGESLPATCFPTASALAATWDPDLVTQVGSAIADEAREFGVGVMLGPGINLKRSPLCGRNFEYFSEDPLLAGTLAAAFIRGVQSRGIGTALKHLAGNDQEHRRMTIDAVYDERTLRELELRGFELAVRWGRPWTVMCAYNRLGGTYACQHPWLLTDVLREEWGHDGIVVTDWGAMDDRVAALAAGCELQMPGPAPEADAQLVDAVDAGRLDPALLDRAATRLVALALRARTPDDPAPSFDRGSHHALARRVAADAAVLCRNEDAALPIRPTDRVAVVGSLAVEPRFQGTGSSRIEPTRLDTLHGELVAALGEDRIAYAAGYRTPEAVDDRLVTQAVAAAVDADVVVVCVGLPDGYENEGADRTDLRLPRSHDALVAALAASHGRVAVVLANGAPVTMPWVDDVEAIVEGYLGGQAGGGGLADVLTGAVDPSGRLAETFPRHLDDVPSTRHFPGGPTTVEHREGLYVGYRFHSTVDDDVLFCFGHGLSYTTFAYGPVRLDRTSLPVDDLRARGVTVSVEVTNTGPVAGREVVQVYVRDPGSAVHRPDRELRAFRKIAVAAGASQLVELTLDERAFSYWHPARREWVIEPGTFEVLAAASADDVRGVASLEVEGEAFPVHDEPAVYRDPPRYLDVDAASYAALLGAPPPPNPELGRPFDRNTPIGATASSAFGRLLVPMVERRMRQAFGHGPTADALVRSMVDEAPLRSLLMGGITEQQLDTVVDLVNGRWVAGGERVLRTLRSNLDRRRDPP